MFCFSLQVNCSYGNKKWKFFLPVFSLLSLSDHSLYCHYRLQTSHSVVLQQTSALVACCYQRINFKQVNIQIKNTEHEKLLRKRGHVKLLFLLKNICKGPKLLTCWLCCGWVTIFHIETMDFAEHCIDHCEQNPKQKSN